MVRDQFYFFVPPILERLGDENDVLGSYLLELDGGNYKIGEELLGLVSNMTRLGLLDTGWRPPEMAAYGSLIVQGRGRQGNYYLIVI